MLRSISALVVSLFGLLASPALSTPGAYADVNGIKLYYESHGAGGTPLVLLHGGGSTIEVTYGKFLPFLATDRQVIAIEEQGHGRTSDREAPVSFETSADDVAALLAHLKIARADLFGFSNGATVALQVAIRHPKVVRKLVHASSFTKKSGAAPGFWEYMEKASFENMPQPLKDAFLKVNPDPKKVRSMHDKDLTRMRTFKDIPDAKIKGVKAPTLVIAGDRDVVTPEHAAKLAHTFPHARLLIVPGGHGDYLGELVMTKGPTMYPELIAGLVRDFLGAP